MSYNPAYRVNLPEKVTLSSEGKQIGEAFPAYPSDQSGHSMVEFNVPGDSRGSLILTFFKDEGTRSIAVEEIEGF